MKQQMEESLINLQIKGMRCNLRWYRFTSIRIMPNCLKDDSPLIKNYLLMYICKMKGGVLPNYL